MSNQVTPTRPIHFEQRDIVFESGGVKFIIHVTADMANINPAPSPVTPSNPYSTTRASNTSSKYGSNRWRKDDVPRE
jgi:hypothetical protein